MKRILVAIMVVAGVQGQAQWIPKDIYKTPDSLMTDSDYARIPNWGDRAMVMVVDSTLIVNNDTLAARGAMVLSTWKQIEAAVDELDMWVTFNFPNRYDSVRYHSTKIVHWVVEFTPTGYCRFKMWGRREPSEGRLPE